MRKIWNLILSWPIFCLCSLPCIWDTKNFLKYILNDKKLYTSKFSQQHLWSLVTDEKILLGERSRLHNRWLPVDRFFAKWTIFCVQWNGWKPHLLKRMKTHGWLGNLRFFCTNLMLGTLDFTGSEHRATLCPVGGYNCSICLRAQPWTWFTFCSF